MMADRLIAERVSWFASPANAAAEKKTPRMFPRMPKWKRFPEILQQMASGPSV